MLKNNLHILQIKIYESYYIKIINYKKQTDYYIKDDKLPLKVRDYKSINRIHVKYIYDTYILTQNLDKTFDIFYKDTIGYRDFDLRNVRIENLSEYQKSIFNKFTNIIKEAKCKINSWVDDVDFMFDNLLI